jgi:galactose mutarotase-like enzyme
MRGVVVRAGEYEATFRPDLAMLGTSLRFRNEEYLGWPRTQREFRVGGATVLPFIHPWGNRLARWGYRAAGKRVSLKGVALPTDTNGLPIHGNMFDTAFEVTRANESRVTARYDYSQREKLRAFPFPHIVTIDARVDGERGLTIATDVTPTSDRAVPISFCFHPYFRMPRAPRRTWELRWPACEHIEVDRATIPTGARTPQKAERGPIGARTFDDHYALGRDRTFGVSTDDRTLSLHFDRSYPFGQLFVPPRRQLVAIEPMTAEINALGHDAAPIVQPGDRFRASFTIRVSAR